MKMVKSLFLGTAAGLVAMTGAQAADLPVKAKPVQYVKICSLYGAGFYYIPGTDMCLKIGGYVRLQVNDSTNGNLTYGPLVNNANTRGTQNFAERARGYITADARNQTEYGTVRGYLAVGFAQSNLLGATAAGLATDSAAVTPGFSANRAFIQFAGFTFGITQSFYDFFPTPALSYFGGSVYPSSDTSDGGKTVIAYTAQFGGGLSASLSAEAPRQFPIYNTNPAGGALTLTSTFPLVGTALNSLVATSQKALQWPDLVGSLRLDQAWGGVQIMGVIHDASATYYTIAPAFAPPGGALVPGGNPADKIGFAIGAGLKLNSPLGPGDYFDAQVNYTQGATGYAAVQGGSYAFYNGGRRQLWFRGCHGWRLWRHPRDGYHHRRQPDDRLGRQRGLRALLEQVVADLALRRLRRLQLQRPGQCYALHERVVP